MSYGVGRLLIVYSLVGISGDVLRLRNGQSNLSIVQPQECNNR